MLTRSDRGLGLLLVTLALATLTVAGCGERDVVSPGAPASRLDLQTLPDGSINLGERGGPLILRGGWAEALLDTGTGKQTLSTRDCAA